MKYCMWKQKENKEKKPNNNILHTSKKQNI